MMSPEEHRQEHIRLHRALDDLLACYLSENDGREGRRRGSIHDEIYALMQWSYQKTLHPSPYPRDDNPQKADA